LTRSRILVGLGFLALGSTVVSFHAPDAQSQLRACGVKQVRIGPVFGGGCWHRVGTRWVAATPVTLDGVKLTGGGTITADERSSTIASSGSVRWFIGQVQIRHAQFTWTWKTPLVFTASGGLRGLSLTGAAALSFSGADGGTARFAAKVAFKALAGTTVSGDTVLTVSSKHAFNVQRVHVGVAELGLGRLLFKKLDFRYANTVWSADASVRLPAFTITDASVDGHIEVANGAVRDIAIGGSGLTVPLGEGLVLTKASLSLNFHPVVIQGKATATYGPPIAGAAPLQIDGSLQYSSEGQHWDANGSVTLPWGLPGVKPSITVNLGLDPGRSLTFKGHLDLTVHGFGVTGDLEGFASPKAFNVEGKTTLAFTPLTLKGDALISSKGMSACGRVQLKAFGFGVGIGPRLGFGYKWGGSFHFIASSCDVGPLRVAPANGALRLAGPTTVITSSPAQFAVFAVQGQGDFQVAGPTGTFSSAGDRDTFQSFALHDTSDNTVYLAIPVLDTAAQYTITTLTGSPVSALQVADGVKSLAGDVTGSVSGSGRNWTLTYGINTAALQPGETVSFYEGQSPDIPGANPIVENATTGGTATITPEATGDTTRTVRAVVFDDGVPREQFFIASFTTTDVPPPAAAVFIRAASTPSGGWTIQLLKPQRVASWGIATTADDGRHVSSELPGTATAYQVAQGTAKHLTVEVTPIDQYGREGPTYVCDSAKTAFCPPG
jgi:hypothetical protein